MHGPVVPLFRPYFDDDDVAALRDVLASGWVTYGPRARELECAVADYVGSRHAIAVNNCTAALHLALLAAGVRDGDEVVVGDYTYPATAHAVLYCGATPVFADIDPATYTMDPASLASRITARTRAVIPVHAFGHPADMTAILELTARHGLVVIEDAAGALGATHRDKHAGTMGRIGCFSFHARKGITTGEGGMIVTDDASLADRMRRLSTFGVSTAWAREQAGGSGPTAFVEAGYNYKMSDIAAAVGVAQLRKLDAILARKRALAACWDRALAPLHGIAAPRVACGARHAYQAYVALLAPGVDRDVLIAFLAARGVQASIGTYACHLQPVYVSPHRCPVSRDVFERALALPLYHQLAEKQIERVAGLIEEGLRDAA